MARFLKAIHISVLFCMVPSARYVQPYLCIGKTAKDMCIPYARKFWRQKNLTNLHFCGFDELKVNEKLGLVDYRGVKRF